MPPPSRTQLAGVLNVGKPAGWTSHDVVALARGALGVRRVGQGGTLDPLARGVLPLLVGPATRFADRLHTARKVYAASIRFGWETTTDDREGERTRVAPPPALDPAGLEASLAPFRGEITQVPPAFAAVKVGGRRAYALARAGLEVVLPERRVTIHRIAPVVRGPDELGLLVVCSTGTYVRSLARDIGRALGSAAHLEDLVRLAVGALDARDALEVERLRTLDPVSLAAALRPADDRLLVLDERYLSLPAAALLAEHAP
ncbi:MAG TPA: tRNA pseudouridine(55) synthase TruB [Candidatus Limnocylindrales bacterium]|nr:tRNA pseudouridine(55) synthase TruB [Candidatus Limnocylindrales bacterium]